MSRGFYAIRRKFGFLATVRKIFYFFFSTFRRFAGIFFLWRYDVLFIHREVFPIGPPFFEKIYCMLNPRVILDFDDAIFSSPTSGLDQRSIFKDEGKLDKMVAMSSRVIVGNMYLYDWAVRFNDNVRMIPTTVYLDGLIMKKHENKKKPVIGWIGNLGNAHYVLSLGDVLSALSKKHDFVLKLVGGADIFDVKIKNVDIDYKLWNMKDEPGDILSFDIGIMPLLKTEFDMGKCGFKIIQYSSMGIPAVASAVGCNNEIIDNEKNGYLAETPEEWYRFLEKLIIGFKFRARMGEKARTRIEKKYNAASAEKDLFKIIKEVAEI